MKDINQLIDINLNLIASSENTEMFYSDFIDLNGEKFYNDIRSKLFAEELESRGLVKIYKELCIITEKGYSIVDNGGWLKNLKLQAVQKQIIVQKERHDAESAKVELSLNKWLLKTKWIPHIIAILSLLFMIYNYIDSKDELEKFNRRIEQLELKDKLHK